MEPDNQMSPSEYASTRPSLRPRVGHARIGDLSKRVRRAVLVYLIGVLLWVALVDGLWLGLTGTHPLAVDNAYFLGGLFVVLGAAAGFQWWRMRGDGGAVARLLGGTPVSLGPSDTGLARLRRVTDELAIRSGMRAPDLFVVEGDQTINAFAAGPDPARSAIAVSRGAVDRLTREELQAVIGHELAHIAHGDTALAMRTCAMTFCLMGIAIIGTLLLGVGGTVSRKASSKKEQETAGLLVVTGLVTMAIGWTGWAIARLAESAASRDQEFRADAQAVHWIGDAKGMVGALTRLAEEQRLIPPATLRSGETGLYRSMYLRQSAEPGWFDSHPSLIRRIAALDPQAAADLPWRR